MTYEIKVVEGCTAFGVFVNGKEYTADDKLHYVVFAEIGRQFQDGRISITDLLGLLEPEDRHHTQEPCEQCGDYITETTYKIQ